MLCNFGVVSVVIGHNYKLPYTLLQAKAETSSLVKIVQLMHIEIFHASV